MTYSRNKANHKIMLNCQLSECHSMLDTNVTAYTVGGSLECTFQPLTVN